MRKLIMFVSVSLNGFFEGPNHDISWHNVDDEVNKFAIGQLRETDTILFGRRTYQLFEGYWPKAPRDPATSKGNLEIANLINNMKKIVFSKTLPKVEEKENWKNVKLMREVNAEEIRLWKQQSGKNMSVGGNSLAVKLAESGLIDEFRVMINPVALGNGTPLFEGIKERLDLKLVATQTFQSGNVLLTYRPAS